jgi:NADH dehydrogenase
MRIVVVGGGYAGVLAANRLAKAVDAEITVVNPRPDFVERVRLHQQVAGTAVAAAPLGSMLRDGIATRVAAARKVGDGAVTLDDGSTLDFDYALLAVGSTVEPMAGTVPIGSWEGAQRARAALAALPAGALVAVVGGGATGVETAAEVATARPDLRVRVVGSPVAATFTGRARRLVRDGLARVGVEVTDDEVVSVDGGDVALASGAGFAADLVLWAIVSGVPELAAASGLDVDAEGRVLVDEFLRSTSDERVFAIGDCAGVPGTRFACQSATDQAGRAATALAAMIAGRRPKPYSVRYLARCVTLGRRAAVAQFTHLDDTPRDAALSGRTAVVLKELATRGAKFGARTGFGA